MHHSWWSYNKTATPRRQENPQILRETELIDLYVWVWTVTFLYSIFLSVLVKATPCIGKDLGMCTVAYSSLMVELWQDAHTSNTRESWKNEGNWADRFVCLGVCHYLVVLYLPVLVKAIPCIGKDLRMCTEAYASLMVELQQDGYTSKMRESRLFEGNQADWFECLGDNHYLAVLYFPASACQSHPMYR